MTLSNTKPAKGRNGTHLTNSQVAEPANQLGLVQRIGSHLHPAHGGHLAVHLEELALGDLDIEAGGVAVVCLEGVFMELEGEGLAVGVRGRAGELGEVGGGGDAAEAQGLWTRETRGKRKDVIRLARMLVKTEWTEEDERDDVAGSFRAPGYWKGREEDLPLGGRA